MLSHYPFAGALGSWSASLLSPYTDLPDTAGLLRYTSDVLKRLIQQFQADGWQTVCDILARLLKFDKLCRAYIVSGTARTR